jgi:hypothetical protein
MPLTAGAGRMSQDFRPYRYFDIGVVAGQELSRYGKLATAMAKAKAETAMGQKTTDCRPRTGQRLLRLATSARMT